MLSNPFSPNYISVASIFLEALNLAARAWLCPSSASHFSWKAFGQVRRSVLNTFIFILMRNKPSLITIPFGLIRYSTKNIQILFFGTIYLAVCFQYLCCLLFSPKYLFFEWSTAAYGTKYKRYQRTFSGVSSSYFPALSPSPQAPTNARLSAGPKPWVCIFLKQTNQQETYTRWCCFPPGFFLIYLLERISHHWHRAASFSFLAACGHTIIELKLLPKDVQLVSDLLVFVFMIETVNQMKRDENSSWKPTASRLSPILYKALSDSMTSPTQISWYECLMTLGRLSVRSRIPAQEDWASPDGGHQAYIWPVLNTHL